MPYFGPSHVFYHASPFFLLQLFAAPSCAPTAIPQWTPTLPSPSCRLGITHLPAYNPLALRMCGTVPLTLMITALSLRKWHREERVKRKQNSSGIIAKASKPSKMHSTQPSRKPVLCRTALWHETQTPKEELLWYRLVHLTAITATDRSKQFPNVINFGISM